MSPLPARHRYRLSWADPTRAGVTSSIHFSTLEECKAYVQDTLKEPADLYDALAKERATLFPSGALRWKNR